RCFLHSSIFSVSLLARSSSLSIFSLLFLFFLPCSGAHRYLHSFPTRRSSDLSLYPCINEIGVRNSWETFAIKSFLNLSSLLSSVDRKSTRLNSSHVSISYAVFCLKKKKSSQRRSNTSPRSNQDTPRWNSRKQR